MEKLELVNNFIEEIKKELDCSDLAIADILYNNNDCQILAQSGIGFDFIVNGESTAEALEIKLEFDDENIVPLTQGEKKGWNAFSFACLMQMKHELQVLETGTPNEHKKYSREGMIKRVLAERKQKAETAKYTVKLANNIFGDHILINEKGSKYKVFLRDFENEIGYSDSADAAINKLGTTKHIMYVFNELKNNKPLFARLSKRFPFVEIYLDPLNDYKVSWFYPHTMPINIELLIKKYFGSSLFIEDDQLQSFLGFMNEAEQYSLVLIRPEVREKIERAYEDAVLEKLRNEEKIDFSMINTDLFPYQKEGIAFAAFRKAAIIADEMGLGKTLQAIGTAIVKKRTFGFKHTLVVCPASLKDQWKKEIEKFTEETAEVISGYPNEREERYLKSEAHFLIVNYETVLRDQIALNKAQIDFLILDEAQRVKNYATQTAHAIKNINRKHVLVITGTPIENKLIDLFSVLSVLDPHFLGPLWEFSYQYCLFDPLKYSKINGYYDLQKLKKKLSSILIRREKRNVLDQLPNVHQTNIPVEMSPLQADYHGSYARGIAQILSKKFITPYDLQRMQLLLSNMRMVCDSTFLIDEETNDSPKLNELIYILLDKLDIQNSDNKIIIFSEWIKTHKLIGRVLRENNIGFAELNGKVPVKLRGDLIKKFETDSSCKVFLSTEAGGAGLNLQVADTLINFELPWNPAKKNQRIGRIDRLGQKNEHLTILNLITKNSIEEKIATGLVVKQNLFDGVLDGESTTNFVDFSAKGRSQFLKQMEEMVSDFEDQPQDVEQEEMEQYEEVAHESQTGEDEFIEDIPPTEDFDRDALDGDVFEQETEEEVQEEDHPVLVDRKNDVVQNPSNETEKENQESVQTEEFEKVMNNGLQFISGLFKLSTGKEVGLEGQKIEIDKNTGEVTLKFKLPK